MKEKSDGKFTCQSSSVAYWYYNENDPLPHNAKRQIDSSLTFSSVKKQNRGYYECHGKTNSQENFKARGLLKIKRKFYKISI